MLSDKNLIAFAATKDLAQARDFFEGVLGLTVVREESEHALVLNANGLMLRVSLVPDLKPQAFTVLGWRVPDIAASVRTLMERGVTFERYAHFDQDELGIMTFSGEAKTAWFQDPDGNLLSLSQYRDGAE